jgi:GMP synthase-like glutamine amidotransferase
MVDQVFRGGGPAPSRAITSQSPPTIRRAACEAPPNRRRIAFTDPAPKPYLSGMPVRLQVFQHVRHEGLGSLEPFFAARGASVSYTRLFAGELPPAPSAYDFLVVLGGPMSVDEEAVYPWLAPEKAAIRAALDAGKSVLGLCLGAQLMSVALGGRVTKNPHREIGWWPVERFPEAAKHWVAACFPDRFTTFHWHGDTFSIPAGATPLFHSEGCAQQGFAWGDRAVALQFHPEITAEAIDSWLAASLAEGGGDLEPAPYVQSAVTLHGHPGDFAGNNAWMSLLCGKLMSP